ncbi:hypothetical protein EDC04DRAFT_1043796 [Pisolithus marmoratus]|nr:hypothetical protein EDC04DRAFT_1043796 [Pisolithus marmoratus]
MTNLSDARAELARLQRKELELLQELLDVQKAVAAQKVLINELIKTSTPPPFDRLPNELLAQIFLIIRYQRDILARVSRRWRAVIMGTPSIWSAIFLGNYTSSTLLRLHLERSGQAPLTIWLGNYGPELLDVVMVHANRWHTLFITGCTQPCLNQISHLRLPFLEVLHVDLEPDCVDLPLMMYSHAPALKFLRLEGLAEPPPSFNLINGQLSHKSLTRLVLAGMMDSWEFPRDSIHLLALESLVLRIKDPMLLLEAIDAPRLSQFEFSEDYCGDPICRAFRGPRTKFDNVHHIIFAPMLDEPSSQAALNVAKELCQVFNGICHADIEAEYIIPLFSPYKTVDHLDGHRSAIDHWTCLESLEIQGFATVEYDSCEYLMDWFTKRKNWGSESCI